MISDPGDHYIRPELDRARFWLPPDPLYVAEPEPKGSPTNPYITGRQVLALVAFAAGVTLLGLAAVRHYEENPSE
jgi:hypothetical protein